MKYPIKVGGVNHLRSLPVRGAWVEIIILGSAKNRSRCRSPCGERGLKSPFFVAVSAFPGGRSPCGERGLKCVVAALPPGLWGRSPCGERGLK